MRAHGEETVSIAKVAVLGREVKFWDDASEREGVRSNRPDGRREGTNLITDEGS